MPVEFPDAGLTRLPKATEVDDPSLPKAVLFRDSFSNVFGPLLSEHFRRLVFVRTTKVRPSILDQEHPDVVMLEIAERFLPKLITGDDPDELEP